MRILFVTAPELKRRSIDSVFPPAASNYLAGFLRGLGHEVDPLDLDALVVGDPVLFDGLVHHPSMASLDRWACVVDDLDGSGLGSLAERLAASIPDCCYDLVAVSARRPEGALLVIRILSDRIDAPIVVGGDVDVDPAEFAKLAPSAAYVTNAYGEHEFPRILENVERGRPPGDRGGAGRAKRGLAGRKDRHDDDRFPLRAIPDPRGLDVDRYLFLPARAEQVPNPGARLLMPFQFVYGCPFRCSFCQVPDRSVKGPAFRTEDPGKVAEALERAAALGVRDMAFFNNTLCVGMRYVTDLCRAITSRGLHIRWSDSANFSGIAPEAMPMLREAGCVALTFGLESASSNVLAKMNRKYDGERAATMLEAAHAADILVQANVIVGFPGETRADYEDTARFVETHAGAIDAVAISPFYLTRSAILREPERYGVRIRSDVKGAGTRHRSSSIAFDELDGDRMTYEERFAEARRRAEDLRERYNVARGRIRPVNDLLEVLDLFTYNRGAADVRERLRDRSLRFLLFVGSSCLNECDGCPYHGNGERDAARPLEELVATLRIARKCGYGRLMLVGGEPTLREDIEDIVAEAKRLGYGEIVLETDGSGIGTIGSVNGLRDAGLTAIALKFEGAEEDAHDHASGRKGAFKGLKKAHALATEAGLPSERALPMWLGAMSPCMSRRAYAELRKARVPYPWERD